MLDTLTRPSLLAAAATTQPLLDAVRGRTSWSHWLILLGGIFAGVLAGRVASALLVGAANRLQSRHWLVRGTTLRSAAGPASLALVTLGLSVGLFPLFAALLSADPTDDPYRTTLLGVQAFSHKVIRFLYTLALGWFLFNLVDVVDGVLQKLTARTESKLDDQLVPLVRKTLRIFVVVVFALFIAQNVFGQDITAWLAGLGIAGLAVSLAAQDSIKNLFGSVTIFMDRPFGIGDYIKVGGSEGGVEEIGFRSTKLRTPTGGLVSIPNSEVVNGLVENVSARPHIRRLLDVTVTYDTPPEKVREAVDIIRRILAEPEFAAAFQNMEKFPPRVYFDEFTADSLRIRVLYWFYPADFWAYNDHAQRFNLRLLEEFNRAGIEFAFPTRTLLLASDPKRKLSLSAEAAVAGNGGLHAT